MSGEETNFIAIGHEWDIKNTSGNAPVQCQLRGKETTRSTSASISSLSGEMVIKTKWYLHKRYSGTSERIIQWTKNKVTELNKK